MYALRLSLQKLSLNVTPSLNDLLGAVRRSTLTFPKNITTKSTNTLTNQELNNLNPDEEEEGRGFRWLYHNKTIFPIQSPEEERRPAYICHMKANLRYSPKKMWYIASFVRGMSVDEAVKQLSFMHKKGAVIVKETILEAQKLAVEKHNVEFKSNLWVAESFYGKGYVIKGLRRHARCRPGKVHYRYCHYFVRLEEGKPPEHYYIPHPETAEEKLEKWMKQMRMRKITNSL